MDVSIDHERRTASVGGRTVLLTRTELRLLEAFLQNPGRTLSRQQLMESCAGGAFVLDRTVDQHVCSLRRKLGPEVGIVTVRGQGYTLRKTAIA